ncbi:hypothetical protein OS190_04500 [Sulfitobacter sp. F26204]|nr:hypothetical protein [Sulfitobacter sp. F26204]MCX7558816.1 hypothetical protein [Sulfitobacter sp. F26204]
MPFKKTDGKGDAALTGRWIVDTGKSGSSGYHHDQSIGFLALPSDWTN